MLIILHLSLMIAGVLCLAFGIGMAVFGRRKKDWLKFHRRINTTGLLIMLGGAGLAFASVVLSGDRHLEGLHQRMGLAAILFMALTLSLGYILFAAQNKSAVRAAHRWSGRLSFLAVLANLLLGIVMIGVV